MRKSNIGKMTASVLAAALCMGTLAGCGSTPAGTAGGETNAQETKAEETKAAEGSEGEADTEGAAEGEVSYPLNSDETLTIWTPQALPAGYTDYNEVPFYKNLGKQIGVNIEWSGPSTGEDAKTAYNLLMAAEELPDIIFYYPLDNGEETDIADGIYVELTDYQEYFPDYLKAAEATGEIKNTRMDNGGIGTFWMMRGDERLTVFQGMVVRQDWLDECGLEVPDTLEEYDTVARTFHEKYGAVFTQVDSRSMNSVNTAFNATKAYYVNDEGEIVLGAIEDNYREYLEFMNQWYEDGILDPDFATMDAKMQETKVLNDQTGLAVTSSGTVSGWISNLEANGNSAEFVAAPYPPKEDGETPEFGHAGNMVGIFGARITTDCENIPLACQVLNWGYTEEGQLYWNFGEEGVSYEMKDGEPVFTDVVMKDEKGIDHGINTYAGAAGNFVTVQDYRMWEQKNTDVGVAAVDVWAETNQKDHVLPNLSSTQEENEAITNDNAAINNYINEMYYKFIMGEESLDDANWQKYVDTIKSMNVDNILKIKNEQLDRWNNR